MPVSWNPLRRVQGTQGLPLRGRLLLLVAAVAIPLVGIAGAAAWTGHLSARRMAEASLVSRAAAIAEVADQEFSAAGVPLSVLARSKALDAPDLVAFQHEMQLVSDCLHFPLSLLDANGRVILATGEVWSEAGLEGSLDQIALTVRAERRMVISNLLLGFTGKPVVLVALPAESRNGTPYLLMAALRPQHFADVLERQIGQVADLTVSLNDRTGTIVARNLQQDPLVARKSSQVVLAAMQPDRGERGMIQSSNTLAGVPAVSGFARAPISRYVVVADLPEARFEVPFQRDLVHTAVYSGLLVLFGCGLALTAAANIAGSFRKLAGKGEWVRTGLPEADRLAAALAATSRERDLNAAELHFLFDCSPIGIVRFNVAGQVAQANAAFLTMVGMSRRQLEAGQVHWPGAPVAGGTAFETRLPVGDKDTLDVLVAPGPAVTGTEATGSAFIVDLSDLKRTERALRQSEAHLNSLVGALDMTSSMVRDRHGRIQFWSQGCERMYGWPADQAVGQTSHLLLSSSFPRPLAEIEAAFERDGEWSGDVVQRRRDGSELMVTSRWVLRRDGQGGEMVAETIANVTSLRQTQAELRQLNTELEVRVRAEVAAREAAQRRALHAERMQALGQLAGGIAHDFNNVLQAVLGGAAMLKRRAGDPEMVARLATMVGDASERGASITRRLLAFARQGDLRKESIEIGIMLGSLREVLVHTLGAGITVRLQVAEPLPLILADKGQLETVLVNLATNARDAMPQGGVVTLGACTESVAEGSPHRAGLAAGRYFRLTVADTGEGMSPDTLARVTEPFFTTKPRGKGTGLGLAMAKGFTEQSGGGIGIESELGQGTTISLWLPVSQQAEPSAMASSGAGEQGGWSPRILFVDDDPLARDAMTMQLESCGAVVIQAQCAAEALEHLHLGVTIDALVTDLSMPGMNGIGLIEAAQSLLPNLPALLITGFADDGVTPVAGSEPGGRFCLLRKPVPGTQVMALLWRLLAAKADA